MIRQDEDKLVDELKRLRKRRGMNAPDLAAAIGPLLRSTLGLNMDLSSSELREALRHKLTELASRLHDEHREATLIAYGLTDRSAAVNGFTARAKLVAAMIDRDTRTAIRQIDKALRMLAKEALALRREQPDDRSGSPWATTSLHTSVLLNKEFPEVYERRRIVVMADSVEEIELEMSVPLPPGRKEGTPPDGTHIEVLHGGTLHVRQRRSSARLGYVLRLSRALPPATVHEFFLCFRFTSESSMRPFYTCTPKFPCEIFDLHVKFHQEQVPARIWRVDDLLQSEVEDQLAPREQVEADACGEVHTTFTGLTPNRSFGVAWAVL